MCAVISLLFLPWAFVCSLQAQTELNVSVKDALGHPLPAARVHVTQEGVKLAVKPGEKPWYYFTATVDPRKPVEVGAVLEGYKIKTLTVLPPFYAVVLSAGRKGDSLITIMGVPTYYKPLPELIAFYPSITWDLMQEQGELAAWEKASGLVRVNSPWPPDPRVANGMVKLEPVPVFYRSAGGKAFGRSGIPVLDSIRNTGMGFGAGVPLWPGMIFTNKFTASSCTAPAEWLEAHHLTATGQRVGGMTIWIIDGPNDLGYGALDLIRLLQASGYFEDVAPSVVVQVEYD